MSASPRAGRPAFPPNHAFGETGLTKREYVATHLAAGMLANEDGPNTPEGLAQRAAAFADALLGELAK